MIDGEITIPKNIHYKNDIENVPKDGGVYFIFNKNKMLIYIGSSNNLYKRLKTHFTHWNTRFSLEDGWFTFFTTKQIPNKFKDKKIINIEKEYIEKFSPKYNTVYSKKYNFKPFFLELPKIGDKLDLRRLKKMIKKNEITPHPEGRGI